jgi:hypothetical protein
MQLTQAEQLMEAAVQAQLRLAEPQLAALGADLLDVLRPAIRQTMMEVVEMAAQEVNGQLIGQRVEVRLVDGEPELSLRSDESRIPPHPTEEVDAEARITLRVPAYLKDLISEAAEGAGDSVNSFVVETLRTKAYERGSSNSVKRTIDL